MTHIYFKKTKKSDRFLKANGVHLNQENDSWYWDMVSDCLIISQVDDGFVSTQCVAVTDRELLDKLKVDESLTDADALDYYYAQKAAVALAEAIAKHAAEFDKATGTCDKDEVPEQELSYPDDFHLAPGETFEYGAMVQQVSTDSGVMLVRGFDDLVIPTSYVALNFTGRVVHANDVVNLIRLTDGNLVAVTAYTPGESGSGDSDKPDGNAESVLDKFLDGLLPEQKQGLGGLLDLTESLKKLRDAAGVEFNVAEDHPVGDDSEQKRMPEDVYMKFSEVLMEINCLRGLIEDGFAKHRATNVTINEAVTAEEIIQEWSGRRRSQVRAASERFRDAEDRLTEARAKAARHHYDAARAVNDAENELFEAQLTLSKAEEDARRGATDD